MLLPLPTGRALRRLFPLFVLALAGCSAASDVKDFVFEPLDTDAKCPDSGVVGGIGRVTRFDGRGTGFVNQTYSATLTEVKSDCSYENNGVTVKLSVQTLAELGPAAPGRSVDLPYFVAVTDKQDKIVAKKVFSNTVSFAGNQNRGGGIDTLTEHVPLTKPRDGETYHVILGFQLSQDELAYNRSQR